LEEYKGGAMTTYNPRGPKKKYGPRDEVHLKFSKEALDFIDGNSSQGRQAFFDALIGQQIQLAEQAMMIGMDLDIHINDQQKNVDLLPDSYETMRNQRMYADGAVLHALEQVVPVLPKYVQTRIVKLLMMRSQIWDKKPLQQENES
jgi:hypothetical protein